MDQDGTVMFGEWLPDLPYYSNPGLVEAKNVIPVDGSYKDYLPLSPQDNTLTSAPKGAFAAINTDGTPAIYVGTATDLYEKSGSAYTTRSAATYTCPTNGYWRFVQFNNLVIATDYSDVPQRHTVGATTSFTTLSVTGTAPAARQVGIINDFVVFGDTSDATNGTVPYMLQWPAIDDPTNWQPAGTSSARAVQSGQQTLNAGYGAVTGIAGGQFYGLAFQQRAITRQTYVGGDIVFQFDTFEKSRGLWSPQSLVQVGNLSYFLAHDGWYVTDGQSVKPIGDGKIDKTFYSNFDQTYRERVTAAIDYQNKCIFWCYPSPSANGVPDSIICYNWVRDRWSHADDTAQLLLQSFSQGYTLEQLDSLFTSIDSMTITLDSSLWQGGLPAPMGFQNGQLATFSGSPSVARLETGETDTIPFGYILVNGVKPLITGNPTDVTVALSARTAQDNQGRSFGTPIERTTRTGICDFRTHGRYVSARLEITGGFDRALGLQFNAKQSHRQ